jgi:hypothetical protein
MPTRSSTWPSLVANWDHPILQQDVHEDLHMSVSASLLLARRSVPGHWDSSGREVVFHRSGINARPLCGAYVRMMQAIWLSYADLPMFLTSHHTVLSRTCLNETKA